MKKHIDSISKNPEAPQKDTPPKDAAAPAVEVPEIVPASQIMAIPGVSAGTTPAPTPTPEATAAETPTPEPTPAPEAAPAEPAADTPAPTAEPATEPAAEPAATPTPEVPEIVPASEIMAASAAGATPTPTPTASDIPTPTATPAATPTGADPDSFETLFPEPGIAIAGPPSWIWWVLLIVASAVLGVVAYGLAQGKFNNWFNLSAKATATPSVTATAKASATPTPTPAPTATTTPTSAATAKSAVTMRVLNGTTVTGAAGTAKSVLEKAGYTVRTVGNATNQNYESTTIYYQTGHKADAEAVQAALTGYTVTLEESTLADPDMILVVVGKK